MAIADFYQKHIKQEHLVTVVVAFGVPADLNRKTENIAFALAEQVATFITSDTEDVENIVPEKYQAFQMASETEGYQITLTLYDSDNVWVEERFKKHDVACYEKFQHTWAIHNHGRVAWYHLRLVCSNPDDVRPRTDEHTFEINDVQPGGIIKIATDFDAHGFEGKFISK